MSTGETLRVATFNIRHGAPENSNRGHTDLLIESCAELDADILGLQEVDAGVARSGFTNQALAVAQALDMQYVFRRARFHNFYGPYGNALLVRGGSIDAVETYKLTGDRRHHVRFLDHDYPLMWENRNAIIADLTIHGFKLAVANLHIGGHESVRRRHLAQTALALCGHPGPQILFGDLNTVPDKAQAWLQPYGYELSESLPTCPSTEPRKAIDHIAGRNISLHNVQTWQLAVSDHRAKTADIYLDG